MNASPFWPLVWKEYRTSRAFWMAMAIMGLAAQGSVAWLARLPANRDWWLYGIALMISAAFAVGIGGTSFAVEHEERTIALLRMLPVRPRQLGVAKVLAALSGLIALLAVLWLAASAMANWQSLPVAAAGRMWTLWGLACLEGLAWGGLYSLTIRQPLRATVMAALTIVLVDSLMMGLTTTHDFSAASYAGTLPFRVLVLLLIVLIDAALLPHWLAGREGSEDANGEQRATTWAAGVKNWRRWGLVARLAPPAWRQSVAHLAWQTFHEGKTSFLLLITVGPAAFVLITLLYLEAGTGRAPTHFDLSNLGKEGIWLIMLSLALLTAINGALVFRADQLHGPRFLAEKGISPRVVWFSRHLVWGFWLWALTATVVLLFVVQYSVYSIVGFLYHHLPTGPDPIWVVTSSGFQFAWGSFVATRQIWQMLLPAYAAGQLASLLIRRGILAVTLGLVLGVLATFWVCLMQVIGASWWWSVLPLPVGFFMATWLRLPAWQIGRQDWRSWIAPAAAVLVPVAALSVAVPAYRVLQIPLSWPHFTIPSSSPAAIDDARATLDLYGQAWDLYLASREQAPGQVVSDRSSGLRPQDEVWCKPVVDLVIEASRRDTNLLVLPVTERRSATSRIEKLEALLADFADEQQAAGNLDTALETCLATLRLELQLHDCNGSHAPNYEETFHRLRNWAAASGQTAEGIREAIQCLKQWHAMLPAPAVSLLPEYEETALTITDLPAAAAAEVVAASELNEAAWITSRLEWERARARALLDWVTSSEIDRAQGVEKDLAENREIHVWNLLPYRVNDALIGTVYMQGSPVLDWLPTTPLLEASPLIWQSAGWLLLRQETDYRATLIILALEAWKAEHGQLPQQLDELVGSDFDGLPLDPFWARPFLYYPQGLTGRSPFLWSALGPQVEDQPLSPRRSDFANGNSNFPYCRGWGQKSSTAIDVLEAGTAYSIPSVEEAQP